MKTTRKTMIALVISMLVLTTFLPAFADTSSQPIQIYVNDNLVQSDVPAYIKDSRTMVPIRFVSEALGAKVTWNELTHGVTIASSKVTIKLTIGLLKGFLAKAGLFDTEQAYDVAPEITNGRTFVPLRFVSEQLGAKVEWDADNKVVKIYSDDAPKPVNTKPATTGNAKYDKMYDYMTKFGVSTDKVSLNNTDNVPIMVVPSDIGKGGGEYYQFQYFVGSYIDIRIGTNSVNSTTLGLAKAAFYSAFGDTDGAKAWNLYQLCIKNKKAYEGKTTAGLGYGMNLSKDPSGNQYYDFITD